MSSGANLISPAAALNGRPANPRNLVRVARELSRNKVVVAVVKDPAPYVRGS
jgi:hypothetical protein